MIQTKVIDIDVVTFCINIYKRGIYIMFAPFHRFLNKIRQFFSKEEKHVLFETQEKYRQIAPNFSNIGFHPTSEATNFQKELFEQIQPGDLVYCKMPLTDRTLKHVPKGHRDRPYLIVKKSENEMYGYACTTHPKYLKPYEKHVFVNMVYDEEQNIYLDSNIQFNKAYILPISHIRSFDKELDQYTIVQIARELKAYENIRNKGVLQFSIPIHLFEGDIICLKRCYYYIRSIKGNQYTVYPFSKNGKEFDTNGLHIEVGNQIDIDHPIVFQNLSIDCLVQLSNAHLNEQIRNAEKKPKEKITEEISYHCIYPIGEILTNTTNNDQYIYLMNYGKESFGVNYEYYHLQIFNLERLNLNVCSDLHKMEYEFKFIPMYKKLIKEKSEHAPYFTKRINFLRSNTKISNISNVTPSYQLDYEIGSILLNPFTEDEFIYLYSIGKSLYGFSFGKKKRIIKIPSNYLEKRDDVCEEVMVQLLENAIETNTGKIQWILKDLLGQYHQPSVEVNYKQKYPIGTILQCTYTDEEYMYLFSIGHDNYGISLDDASQDFFDFSTIDLYSMKENGSLVIEDALYILYGVAQDTIRLGIVRIIENQVKSLNLSPKFKPCI